MSKLKRFWPSLKSLQVQLLTLYLAFVVPVAAIGVAFDQSAADRLRLQVVESDIALAQSVAFDAQGVLQSSIDTVNRFAELSYLQVLSRDDLSQSFRSAVSQDEGKHLFFLWAAPATEGQPRSLTHFTSIPYSATLDDQGFLQQPFLQNLFEGGAREDSLSVAVIRQITGESGPVAVVARRWASDQAPARAGIVGETVPLAGFSRRLATIQQLQLHHDDLTLTVQDSTGQIVASSDAGMVAQPSYANFPLGSAQPIGPNNATYLIQNDPKTGQAQWLYSFVPIAQTGWRIVLQRSASTAFALATDFHTGLLVVIIFYLICGIVLWWLVSRRVVSPLKQFQRFSYGVIKAYGSEAAPSDWASSVAQPDVSLAQLAHRQDEVGSLSQSLQQLESDLRSRLYSLGRLFDSSRRLTTTLLPDEVNRIILEETARLIQVAGCWLIHYEFDPRQPLQFERIEGWRVGLGKVETVEAARLEWLTEAEMTRQALTQGQTTQFYRHEVGLLGVTDLSSEAKNTSSDQPVLLVSLEVGPTSRSAIVAIGRAGQHYTSEQISLIGSFANQAALALRNARLYGQSDERLKQKIAGLTALHEIARAINSSREVTQILEQIAINAAHLTESEWCRMRLADGSGQQSYLAAYSHAEGSMVQPELDAAGDPINLPLIFAIKDSTISFFRQHPHQPSVELYDLDSPQAEFLVGAVQVMRQTGTRAYLSVPLRWQEDIIGTLNVYRLSGVRFSSDTIQLLTVLANQAAVAIVNARLYSAIAGEKGRLEAITQSLTDGLLVESLSGQVLYANQGWEQALRADAATSSLVGQPVGAIMQPLAARSDRPEALLAWEQSVLRAAGDSPSTGFEFGLGQQEMRLKLFKVRDLTGQTLGWGRLLQDITPEKELDRARTQLINTVSHELRTPLSIIKGYASTLLQTDVTWDAPSQREFLENILTESDYLANLVTSLLDLSKLEMGRSILSKQPCELDEIVAEVVGSERVRSHRQIELQLEEVLPSVELDPRRIKIVVRNLIENALKYSPLDSAVAVRVGSQPDRTALLVEVADQGWGVPPDERERIFNRFYRLPQTNSLATGGTGLGLAICKAFVEAHQGRIWVETRPETTGSLFRFTLPL